MVVAGSQVIAFSMQTDTGATPLYISCGRGDRKIALLLLDRGAAVNQPRVRNVELGSVYEVSL